MRFIFWPFKATWWLIVRTIKLLGHWLMFPVWLGAVVWATQEFELERPQTAALIFAAVFASRGFHWVGMRIAPPHLRFSGGVKSAPKEPPPPAAQMVAVALTRTARTPNHRQVMRMLPRELRRALK